MSSVAIFLGVLALDVGGLVLVYFLLRARIRRYLELDKLLEGVREEARALVMELNETADRNVSLVEDRLAALRSLLDEADRRVGVARRELETRETEREVFDRLRRRRPILSDADRPIPLELRSSEPGAGAADVAGKSSEAPGGPTAAAHRREIPELSLASEAIQPRRDRREEALDLHRKGFSASIIAARLGATVAEIELLVDLEDVRSEAAGLRRPPDAGRAGGERPDS